MEYISLGKSGLKVSQVCLGTMTFGREADERTSYKILDRFVDLGGNTLDTADEYSLGLSEQIVGRWAKARGCREAMVVATKVYTAMGTGPNDAGLSRLHVRRAVEGSLRRLQTDVIDLYQIHRWDPQVPVEETLEILDDLVREGKVRYIGCSNLKAWHLCRYLAVAKKNHWSRFVSIQPILNALNRSIETEILPLADHEGLGVITYNPLAGGMLTGKYGDGQPMPKGARLETIPEYRDRYYTEEALLLVERFVQAARDLGVTPPQLALAWVLAEPRITCPIVGARNLEQLDETLGGLTVALTGAQREAIPAVLPGRWVGKDQVYDREFQPYYA